MNINGRTCFASYGTVCGSLLLAYDLEYATRNSV